MYFLLKNGGYSSQLIMLALDLFKLIFYGFDPMINHHFATTSLGEYVCCFFQASNSRKVPSFGGQTQRPGTNTRGIMAGQPTPP